MINRSAAFAALLSTTMLAACATAQPEPVATVPAATAAAVAEAPAAPAESPHDRLFRLFKQSDEDSLRRNPISGIFRGDLRYAHEFGDYITDEYFAKEKAATEAELAALRAIPRDQLSATDQLAYDVFEYGQVQGLEGFEPRYFLVNVVRPINHFSGFHTFYPTFASGKGAAPFKTVADYENNIRRHAGYATLLDRSIERFRQGMASGVFETKLTIRNVIEQLDEQLKQKPEESQLYAPVKNFPATIGAEDRARLTAATRAAIAEQIYPAMTRVRDFLKNEYLPRARDQVGLSAMKGGAALYEKLVRDSTTLPLTADQVHNIGLSEVARIKGEMEKVRQEVGFKGTLQQFFEHLRTDPKFKMPTREALTQRYYEIGKAVDAKLPEYFSTLPKAKLEIRPYDPVIEKFQAGGSYEQGTPDGSRPGVFYFNAYDLPSRTTPGMTTLYLHEGSPGHHFQISLALEAQGVPMLRRVMGFGAFQEGWALYSEQLIDETGFYKDDPFGRIGYLQSLLFRAVRLVVDSGLHYKKWSREQAIRYMVETLGDQESSVTTEVERYCVWPGQACSYKVGHTKIVEIRENAKKRLGAKFDIKGFHDAVLLSGAMPLEVLERRIDDWVKSRA